MSVLECHFEKLQQNSLNKTQSKLENLRVNISTKSEIGKTVANKLAKGEKLEDREIVEYANQRMLEFESLPEVNAGKIKLLISADRCPDRT